MTIVTRLGYCENCAKEHRPKTGQQFIAFGDKSQSFIGMTALRSAKKGFTPHLYEFQRLTDKTIYFRKICCMVGCGSYIASYKEKVYIYIYEDLWIDDFIPINDWNALCLFKDTGFNI